MPKINQYIIKKNGLWYVGGGKGYDNQINKAMTFQSYDVKHRELILLPDDVLFKVKKDGTLLEIEYTRRSEIPF